MKPRTSIGLIIFLFVAVHACTIKRYGELQWPQIEKEESVLCHNYYCFVYDTVHMQSRWLAYKLTADMIVGEATRSSRFFVDTLVLGGTANDNDYRGSGYDRGHLVPAGDMVFNDTAMRESFFYSNVSPQVPAFNRGIWKRLEQNVRQYAHNLGKIYVVTGPLLGDDLSTIGESEVSVPDYFYKAILVYNDSIQAGIAFLMPNERGEHQSLYRYSMSIRELEQKTGINFFPALGRRHNVETTIDTLFWQLHE
ncbi:MAG: DNA/RNA non-specific endonuclease [Cryomorphaceae bacterium]|nr:DNA/RNA non-specific endonuclease [Cryomorphaceae bacterium]